MIIRHVISARSANCQLERVRALGREEPKRRGELLSLLTVYELGW